MLRQLLFAWCLMSACVATHAVSVALAGRALRRAPVPPARFAPWSWMLIGLAGRMILSHLGQITLWAVFYLWQGAMSDLSSALYFSAVTYTTTGYGDLVLPREWWLVGAVEALTGILMCGWSTGFFFAVASRMFDARSRA